MLYKLEVRTTSGSLLSLPLGDSSSGYEVRDIQGIEDVEATISSSTFAGVPGSQFHSAQLADRNITMKVGFKPDYVNTSVRSLRRRLASFFKAPNVVELRFYDDEGPTVVINGRVEYCQTPPFAEKPEAAISVVCFDPDFLALDPVIVNGSTVSSNIETSITYAGSAPTGFIFTLGVNRALTEFTIYYHGPNGLLSSMDVVGSFQAGDLLTISTVTGAKSATLTRAGINSSVMYAISPQSTWLQLQEGANSIRVYATGAAIPYSITYKERYAGL